MGGAAGFGEKFEGRHSAGEVRQLIPFPQEGVCASVEGLLDLMVLVGVGQNENGNVRELGMFADPAEESHAAAIRICEIENDKSRQGIAVAIGIYSDTAKIKDGLVTVARDLEWIADIGLSECLLEEIDKILIVLD